MLKTWVHSRVILLSLLLTGCSSVSITVAKECTIVQHAFWNISYWKDVKCISKEDYEHAHLIPPKVIYKELIEKD